MEAKNIYFELLDLEKEFRRYHDYFLWMQKNDRLKEHLERWNIFEMALNYVYQAYYYVTRRIEQKEISDKELQDFKKYVEEAVDQFRKEIGWLNTHTNNSYFEFYANELKEVKSE